MSDNDDAELVSMTKAIMFGNHHQAISDEQARGIIALVLGGRQVANPSAYLRHALAQSDGARYAPAVPADAPSGRPVGELDLITERKAMMLRATDPGVAEQAAATAHRGADLARKLLADRPRPEVPTAAVGGELHGAALARAQAEQSRAQRERVPDPPPPGEDDERATEDVPLPEDGAIADARATREHMRRWADGADEHPGQDDDEDDISDDDGEDPPY